MAEKQTYLAPEEFRYQYRHDYTSDWEIHRDYIQEFDAYEAMLVGQVYDAVSKSVDGGRITDSYATTLAKERADRVMAKLPDGETVPMGKADVGKAAFMDILRQKWIYPNANAQHSFKEKLNMWQLYSSVYGYMPMFYDWNENYGGYRGPDCWLWSPRNLIPQQGKTSIADMDYVTALVWVSKHKLQEIRDGISEGEEGGWDVDALDLLIEQADKASGPDNDKDTKIARDRTPSATQKGVCLATRYEAGEDGNWCTFAPEHGFIEVRKLKNPHKNGRIPFVIKYSQPLFDSFYGLGDFQRAKPLQFARDGLTNFYFKGIKMNLIPPIVANANGVMKHTIDYREGAVMMETIPNSIRRLETSNAGLATYQGAMQNLTGSLLSLYGSQNASIPGAESLNPSQGRTPQAIALYSDKEATRDGAERRHLEDAIEELTDGFFSMVVNIGSQDIPIVLFADDIESIVKSGMSDIKDIFKSFKPNVSDTAGELKIDPAKLKGIEYRFNIKTDSTAQLNQQAVLQAIQDFMDRIGKMQNVFQSDPRLKINWQAIMAAYEEVSGIPNASEFISFDPKAQPMPQPQAAPSPTAVSTQGGQLHESADLVKLYQVTTDEEVKRQILAALGFQPAAPQQPAPTVTPTGHAFQDPTIAAAAGALLGGGQAPPTPAPQPPSEPTVIGSGHAFNDATLGAAADAVNSLGAPAPANQKG